MQLTKTDSHSLRTVEGLLNLLEVETKKELQQAILKDYRQYKKFKNGKYRLIEEPNHEMKEFQKKILKYFQENLICPNYCMAGFKGQNNIKNALAHRFKREIITTDISHCFPNTQTKYVRKFFAEKLGITGEVLELLVALTTYNDHLPTGAPTSSILVCFVHKEIFDTMYKKMQENDIDMTVYIDDITLSSKKHIRAWVIKYLKNLLKQHGLHIKKAKTKRYGYKYAVITGVHISQSGKISAPFEIGYSVIQALKEKDLKEMSINELQEIIGKISYLQQFQKSKMIATKNNAINQIKYLQNKDSSKNNA